MFRTLIVALPLVATSVAFADDAPAKTDAKADATTEVTFAKLDADKDAKLTITEVSKVEDLKTNFAKVDTDESGTLNETEFDAWVASKSEKGAEAPAAKVD